MAPSKKPKDQTDQRTYEVEYAEVVRELRTTYGPLPDGASLAQPSPYRTLPSFVTYGAYDDPILG